MSDMVAIDLLVMALVHTRYGNLSPKLMGTVLFRSYCQVLK